MGYLSTFNIFYCLFQTKINVLGASFKIRNYNSIVNTLPSRQCFIIIAANITKMRIIIIKLFIIIGQFLKYPHGRNFHLVSSLICKSLPDISSYLIMQFPFFYTILMLLFKYLFAWHLCHINSYIWNRLYAQACIVWFCVKHPVAPMFVNSLCMIPTTVICTEKCF